MFILFAPVGILLSCCITRRCGGSLAPQSVLQSANSVLHFALKLISLSFAFELAVASYLSNDFLHFALGLLGRALDAIFVHHDGLQYFEHSRNVSRQQPPSHGN